MATTTTTIWEGHGLEVRRQVTNNAAVMQAAPGSPTTFEALVEIELVLYRRMHYPPQQVLARVFSEKQIRKIEKNSDSWAMGIVHQSVRRARNRALRCHNALTAAQQAEDRWIALAEPFGIRPDEERMVEVPHRARRLGQMVDRASAVYYAGGTPTGRGRPQGSSLQPVYKSREDREKPRRLGQVSTPPTTPSSPGGRRALRAEAR